MAGKKLFRTMEFFYRKKTNLNEENNFTHNISKDNNVEGQHFIDISNLELILTDVDLTKWDDFDRIKKISQRINKAKNNGENKMKIGHFDEIWDDFL